MVKGLILGIAIGIGVGWLLFAGSTEPARTHATVVVEEPESAPTKSVERKEAVTPEMRKLDSGSVQEALATARRTRDWEVFHHLLTRLVEWGPEADRIVIGLAADESLRFHRDVGELFRNRLLDSELEGIGAAALFRLRDAIERGSWMDARYWLELVAHHGGEAEIDALVPLLDKDLRGFRKEIVYELAHNAKRPEVARRFEMLFVEDREDLRSYINEYIDVVGYSNPPLAYRLARERIGSLDYTNIGPFAEALWRGASEAQLDEATALLNGLDGELTRLYALEAVLGSGRAEPFAKLGPLLELPVLVIERAAQGERSSSLALARALLRGRDVLWTRRSLAAMEAYLRVADTFDRSEIESNIAAMKFDLGITRTDWDPER